ncbi:nucleotide exchange factor GrpE [Nocardiopsis salina]|uniref:nucleotide exchange factor GrpE n=1 Tax=Nocardiopsis salina TaxID=245836 RepID=UPI000347E96C|nr:nucleotide exchange factor GrpE [Nocardiopsis salina]
MAEPSDETEAPDPAPGAETPVPAAPEPAPGVRDEAPGGQEPAAEAPVTGPEAAPASEGMSASVEGLAEQVRGFHARADNYEQIIRQMQNRIEQLQGDQVQALLKPVIRRFAGLHSQAAEAAERARERGEKSEKDFDFFMDSIEEALGLIDVESVEAESSTEFDPAKHHAARVVTTDDPEKDRRVHRVLRQGFTYVDADRVFLPAQVSVYKHEEPR